MTNQLKIIVGLGNPGEQFKETRHNAGFEILNAFLLAIRSSGTEVNEINAKKHNCKLYSLSSPKAVFAYPQSYMNLSGQPVKSLLDWYKILDLKNLLIVHDDVALPIGKIRWTHSSGAGGQHGVESIIQHLGGRKDFVRLRFGIGPDPGGEYRSSFVLSKFRPEEENLFNLAKDRSLESLELFLHGADLQNLMNSFNGLP